MKVQNYKNHVRYYPPHHFIFLPLMTGLLMWGVRNIFYDVPHRLEFTLFSIICFCILYLAIMLRQHYALGNQDRIVRLEFRLRYFELFGLTANNVEDQLSMQQIKALRFADDNEFMLLLNRAIEENLSGDAIKKTIINWRADYMRV